MGNIDIEQQKSSEKIVISVSSMSNLETKKLRIYMEDCPRQMYKMDTSLEKTIIVVIDNSIKNGFSFFSTRDIFKTRLLLSLLLTVASISKKERFFYLFQTHGGALIGHGNKGHTKDAFDDKIEPSM